MINARTSGRLRAPGRAGRSAIWLGTILFLSGACGLGYEIAWVYLFSLGLGHEAAGLLAVLAAFFAGLAVGAGALDRVIAASRRPALWYVGLEVVIGLWAFVTSLLVPHVAALAARWLGPAPSALEHTVLGFAVPFVVLLPATIAMGGTLPAMERFLARRLGNDRLVGRLYAVNTAGAVAGIVWVTFASIPRFGIAPTLWGLGGLNLLCALLVAGTLAARGETRPDSRGSQRPLPGTATIGIRRSRLVVTLIASGLLGIGYEVVVVRVLGQVLENTVFSFASALSIYLAATALGAALQRLWTGRTTFERELEVLLVLLAGSVLAGLATLPWTRPVYEGVRDRLGRGFGASISAELTVAAIEFLLPALLSGALFSHLAQGMRRRQDGVGHALALNTAGAAAGPALFGVLALPRLGVEVSLLVIGAGYLLLAWTLRRREILVLVPLAAIALWTRVPFVEVEPPARILAERQGALAHVATVEDGQGNRQLKVNNQFYMGGTGSTFGERRLGHIPILLHPAPERVLFLGVGTGITMSAALDYPGLRADGVELLPEILDMLPLFEDANGAIHRSPRARIDVADAARHLRATGETYDVIVADLFHPARDGAGSLYTREHFELARRRLRPGGVFCQWLPLYQLDGESMRVIVRTFLDVFPEATGHLAYFNIETPALGLIGSPDGAVDVPALLGGSANRARSLEALQRVELATTTEIAGTRLATAEGLRQLVGDGPLNTVLHPLVTYGAPRFVYQQPPPSYVLLEELLDGLGDSDAGAPIEVREYMEARDEYLRGEIALARGEAADALRHYLASAARGTPLAAGYRRVVQIARARAVQDPATARRLLALARDARPDLTAAPRALEAMDAADADS